MKRSAHRVSAGAQRRKFVFHSVRSMYRRMAEAENRKIAENA